MQPNTVNLSTENSPYHRFESPKFIMMVLIAAIVVIGGLWYLIFGRSSDTQLTPTLIRAESGPFKIKPENDAQPVIPHQDKLVYNRLNPSGKQKSVERLLPPPEALIEIPQRLPSEDEERIFANDPDFDTLEQKNVIVLNEIEEKEPVKVEPQRTQKRVRKKVQTSPSKIVHVAKKPKTSPAKKSVVENTKKTIIPPRKSQAATMLTQSVRSKSANRYRIQIASMRTPALANKEWQRLQNGNRPLLGKLKPHFVRVDLGAKKGVFYRVQAGKFTNQVQARKMCKLLNQGKPKVSCLVVKP